MQSHITGAEGTGNGRLYVWRGVGSLREYRCLVCQDAPEMKTFRITYTKVVEHIVELEASSSSEAWERIKSETYKPHLIWEREGHLVYNVTTTEEIVKNIASNPK